MVFGLSLMSITDSLSETKSNEDSDDTSNPRSVSPHNDMDGVQKDGHVPQTTDQLGHKSPESTGRSVVEGRPAGSQNHEVAELGERVRQLEESLRLVRQQKGEAETNLTARTAKVAELEKRHLSLEQGRLQAEERARQAADDVKEKDKELAALREFLCLHDFSSEAELKRAVTRINDMIEDVAQRVADQLCDPDTPIPSSDGASEKPPHQEYKPEQLVGLHFLSILEKCPPQHDETQTYLQWALQAAMVYVISDYLGLFFFPGLEERSADSDYRDLSEVIQKG
ncbi:hypothetical protein FRB99_001523, partial [Tulasnella sp. 403]